MNKAKLINLTASITPMQWHSTLHGEKWGSTIVFRGHPALVVASHLGTSPQRDNMGQLYTSFPIDFLDIISPRLIKAGYKLSIKTND